MAKVLLIDNHSGFLESLRASLARAEIEVIQASCVLEALERSMRAFPDLIISTEFLQGLSAVDLLELRAAHVQLRSIPVLILARSPRSKTEMFKAGCDDFIVMPIDEPELVFRVCALLRRQTRGGLEGSFDDVGLVDVIQLLASSGRSGRCSVRTNGLQGEIFFSEGQIVHAVAGEEQGESAFLHLLRAALGHGGFRFESGGANAVRTIEKRTDHLLLELANVLDEERTEAA